MSIQKQSVLNVTTIYCLVCFFSSIWLHKSKVHFLKSGVRVKNLFVLNKKYTFIFKWKYDFNELPQTQANISRADWEFWEKGILIWDKVTTQINKLYFFIKMIMYLYILCLNSICILGYPYFRQSYNSNGKDFFFKTMIMYIL